MSITPCKDKSGKPVRKNGLQKYRVRVSCTVRSSDGSVSYKVLERTAYGKAEAQAIEKQLAAVASEARSAPSDAPKTVSELSAEYLTRLKVSKSIRESSHAKKESILRNHIIPYLSDIKLTNLNTQVLLRWQDDINSKPIGLTMKRHTYAELRALLNYAVKCEYLQSNPLSKVDNFKDANESEHPEEALHFYTAEQFLAFDSVLATDASARGRNLRTLFSVLFYTGVRKGEAQAFKWSDYDGRTLWVRRSVAQKVAGKRITETPPKNKSSYRKVSVPEPLKVLLEAQRSYQQQDPAWTEEWRICGGPDVISDTTVSNANRKTATDAGLPPIRIHDFRHSHASLLINAGVNIKAISARLGHATVEQTWNRYGHLYPEQDDRILDVLNQIEQPQNR